MRRDGQRHVDGEQTIVNRMTMRLFLSDTRIDGLPESSLESTFTIDDGHIGLSWTAGESTLGKVESGGDVTMQCWELGRYRGEGPIDVGHESATKEQDKRNQERDPSIVSLVPPSSVDGQRGLISVSQLLLFGNRTVFISSPRRQTMSSL